MKRVGIFSILDPAQHGGLETYIRILTQYLQAGGYCVAWNGETPPDTFDMRSVWQPRIARLLPLMTRRSTRHLATKIAEIQGFSQCKKMFGDCDVMHFVGVGWNLFGFPLAKVARQRGAVATCWPAVHPGECGDDELDFLMYRRMNAIFAQSDFERHLLVSRGLESTKVIRCDLASPNLANGNASRFQEKFDLKGRQMVLFIGRRTSKKGYMALRSAMARLVSEGRPVTLVTIGRTVDADYPEIPARAEVDLGCADEDTKQDALAACDVLAVPSRAESFGLVYTEAWAYGKPVICGESPASRELVNRHGAGVSCRADPQDIAEKLAKLLDNEKHRRELGAAGRVAVTTHLNWEKVVATHTSVWESEATNLVSRRASADG